MAVGEIKKICVKCGKAFSRREKFYNRDEANRWQDWAEKTITLCPECSKEKWVSEIPDEITEFEQENNLPDLIGSEKQIAWARKIRYKRLKSHSAKILECLKKAIVGFEESDLDMDKVREAGLTVKDISDGVKKDYKQSIIMLTNASAKEIIENRDR